MPRAVLEDAKSTERIPYHLRPKPATPIEIPRRQRLVPSLDSPTVYPSSPDLLFEMSPISATFSPLSTMFSVGNMSPDHPEDDEPFMYRVPVFRTSGLEDRAWPRQNISRESVIVPSRTSSIGPLSHSRRADSSQFDTVVIAGDMDNNFDEEMAAQSTTKITGFSPLKPDQPPSADLLPRLVGRLSPPPRRASCNPTLWSPSGTGRPEEDMAYSQVDPSTFEFQRHLLRRIESKDRFASLRCL